MSEMINSGVEKTTDEEKRVAQLETENRQLRDAAMAFQALAVCYRTGKSPSEQLFKRLEKAQALLTPKS